VQRVDVLRAIAPAVRAAVAVPGILTADELSRFRERDLALGQRCTTPAVGTVAGVAADGALLVDTGSERASFYAGSLVLAADARSLGEFI
jgi:hypothetical protein